MPDHPTSLGGPGREFPATRWSLIREAGGKGAAPSRAALDLLCHAYWKPVYAYLRSARSLKNEAAKDLTQEFFLDLLDGGLLARYAPERGSFRRYLKGALHLFLREHHRQDQAAKRGGGRKVVSLDDDAVKLVDVLADRAGKTPEEIFDQQWANALLEQAAAALKAELLGAGRAAWHGIFDRYDLNRPVGAALTYADLAREFGVKETDVTNILNHCRKRLREIVLQCVRETVAFEGEISVEVAELFPSGGR